MALVIEDNELDLVMMNKEDFKLEIAILLYEKGKISAGKASAFTGMNRIMFLNELARRRIPVNYDKEELMKDLDTVGIASDGSSQ